MDIISKLLTEVGNYAGFIIVACIELVLAIFLFVKWSSVHKAKTNNLFLSAKGNEKHFLEEIKDNPNRAYLLVQTKDKLSVFFSGDIEKLIHASFKDIQENPEKIMDGIKGADKAKKVWRKYLDYDGTGIIQDTWQMKDDTWLQVAVERSKDNLYDLFYFEDITAFHNLQTEYEERLLRAEDESEAKTTFLSRMSHEIRTPLNGIMGLLSLAQEKINNPEAVKQYLDKTDELSEHLLSLINDILDMSRIEAGKIEIENTPFSIKNMGKKLYDMFSKELEARNIKYSVNFEDTTVDYVIGDELRVSQVIINFLSNSVKFTEHGEINVTFRQMMLRNDKVDFMIRVHDTGIGMSPEFINRIFRPFEQENADTTKKYGGTGLGMAITDRLVKLMGGEIVVDSREGVGSDFSVYLRFPVATEIEEVQNIETAEEDTSYADAFKNRRILLAEDNELNASISVEILSDMGATIDVASNGLEAIEIYKNHPDFYYDFILMDVQMPKMDGRSATKEIRKLDKKDAKSILIFALSADAFVEDERLSLESGMNGHFAKPIDYHNLLVQVGKQLKNKGKE